jgi:hypothetical protein
MLYLITFTFVFSKNFNHTQIREPLLKGNAQYSWPLVLTSLDKLTLLTLKKQATLMRRSAVLSLPLQLVFLGQTFVN